MNKKKRVALVTGGSAGIGLGICQRLYAAGYHVASFDLNEMNTQLIGDSEARIHAAVVDVSSAVEVERAVGELRNRWKTIDILVNNAGISPKNKEGIASGVVDVTEVEWNTVLNVNLTSALRLCQLIIPTMIDLGWGRIVNISSQAARTRGMLAGVAYACSKAALLALTRNIANEYGPAGITANTLCPGRIDSPMAKSVSTDVNDRIVQLTPVRRSGLPEDVAAAVNFLVSEEASFVNGAILDVTGGFYMP
jgi:3-oxoacyl-[acyl-carrier protein] reductase